MFSMRQFARSISRSSRIASYSTRTTFRPLTSSSLRQITCRPQISQPCKAAFSTSIARRDDWAQELSAKLDHEIQLESENTTNETDSDTNTTTFLSQNPHWTVTDTPGDQDVILTRTYDDNDAEKITVSFSIVDFNTPAMMAEDEADEAFMDEEEDGVESAQSGGGNTKGAINQGRTSGGNVKVAPEDSVAPADREELRNEEDDYESQQAFPANVSVLIQRPSNPSAGSLRINLVTDNGRFTIHGVTHLPSTSTTDPVELLRSTPENLYTGPPFSQLDEEVQGILEQYLDARGINTALALFIPDYIDVKEQREYLEWLRRVKGFVE